jgi:hypothetical protein
MVSLKAQRRITESELVFQEFARAWKQAAALRIEDL